MVETDLSDVYRDYIACLNKQDWPKLEQFVHDKVCYNGRGEKIWQIWSAIDKAAIEAQL